MFQWLLSNCLEFYPLMNSISERHGQINLLVFLLIGKQVKSLIYIQAEKNISFIPICNINKNEFNNVKYVSIDMNTTYRDFAYHHFKNCIVMVDSFHVVKNINEALKNLRIHVMYKQDKDSVNYYLLKHWNHLLMKRKGDIEDNIPQYNKKIGYAINKPQILELMLKIDPILKQAYKWKEDYLNFNEDYTFDNASQKYCIMNWLN